MVRGEPSGLLALESLLPLTRPDGDPFREELQLVGRELPEMRQLIHLLLQEKARLRIPGYDHRAIRAALQSGRVAGQIQAGNAALAVTGSTTAAQARADRVLCW